MSEPDQNIADRLRGLIATLISAAHQFSMGDPGPAVDSLRVARAQLGAVSARADQLYGSGVRRRPLRKKRT